MFFLPHINRIFAHRMSQWPREVKVHFYSIEGLLCLLVTALFTALDILAYDMKNMKAVYLRDALQQRVLNLLFPSNRNCLKAYHPYCVGKDTSFMEGNECWTCGEYLKLSFYATSLPSEILNCSILVSIC